MSALTDREFLDFLESYKFLDNDTENPRYYNVITELSRSNPTSGNGRPLIENDDINYELYDNKNNSLNHIQSNTLYQSINQINNPFNFNNGFGSI